MNVDLDRLRPIVAHELQDYHENRDRQTAMRLQKENPTQIWKFYQKLISQDGPVLPSFPVFLTLPAVKLLQSPDLVSAKVSVKTATSDRGVLKKLVEQQVKEWGEKVKIDLMNTMDPSGSVAQAWKNRVPTSKEPHPVDRHGIMWKCKVCNWVENPWTMDECFDFEGVCRHQCKEAGGKKKRGTTSRPWSIDNFVIDEQVSLDCLS